MKSNTEKQEECLKTYEKYKLWVEINRYKLDKEVAEHPTLHQQIGEELALAKSLRDQAEVNIDIIKADLNNKFREEAVIEGERITEDRLKNRVLADRRTVEAQQEYLNWKHLSDLWYSLDKAFGERWPMLQELGKLCLAGYYEQPSMKSEAPKQVADRVKLEQTRHRLQRQGQS